QDRPGEPPGDALLPRDDADADRPLFPDPVVGQELLVVVDSRRQVRDELRQPLRPSRGQVERKPPDAHAVEREAGAAVLLEEIENLLALPEGVPEGRHRAEIDAGGAEPHEMRREALELVENHPDELCATRYLDA